MVFSWLTRHHLSRLSLIRTLSPPLSNTTITTLSNYNHQNKACFHSTPSIPALGVVDQLHEEVAIALPAKSSRSFWEVVEFRPDGTALETWKTPEVLGLHPRDVHLFASDSGLATRAMIAPRADAILFRTEVVKAVVYADRAVIFPTKRLQDTVKVAQAVKSSLMQRSVLPFELKVLEALLSETARAFDTKSKRLAMVAETVIEDINRNFHASVAELQRLIPITRKLTEMQHDVKETLDAITDVVDYDDQLQAFCLTERARAIHLIAKTKAAPKAMATTEASSHDGDGNSNTITSTGQASQKTDTSRTSHEGGSSLHVSTVSHIPHAVPIHQHSSSPSISPKNITGNGNSTTASHTVVTTSMTPHTTDDTLASTPPTYRISDFTSQEDDSIDITSPSPGSFIAAAAAAATTEGSSQVSDASFRSSLLYPSATIAASSSQQRRSNGGGNYAHGRESQGLLSRTPHMRMASRILESYEYKMLSTHGSLKELLENMEQTRTVWHMQLDHQRNRVLRVNLLISIASLGGLMSTLPAAFFGMNLDSGFENVPGVFWPVVQGSTAAGMLLAGLMYAYYKFGPKRRYAARLRDMRSLRDLLYFHMDDIDAILEAVKTKGTLTKAEFSDVVSQAVKGRPMSQDEITLLFRVFDSNRDAVLELSELVRMEELQDQLDDHLSHHTT